MVTLFSLHIGYNVGLLAVSVVIAGSLVYWCGVFKGSRFAKSWNIVLAATIFLVSGAVIDLILMKIYPAEQLAWMVAVQEIFIFLFLAFSGWGLYSMAKINRGIIQNRQCQLNDDSAH